MSPSRASSKTLSSFALLETFLNDCPSQWHASGFIDQELKKAGFKKLTSFQGPYQESAGYYVEIGPGARLAFRAKSKASSLSLIGCHSESPMLRVKENGLFQEEGVWIAHVEPYGSPILASWMYKDLGLCARVISKTNKGLNERLINIAEPLGLLLSPAIHLDRDINQKGLVLDKQKHLKVLMGSAQTPKHPLLTKTEERMEGENIFSYELYFYPLEKAKSLALDSQWIASWRIDNLASCSACLEALLESSHDNNSPLTFTLFADHEEIGSQTYAGAASSRYRELIDEILLGLGYGSSQIAQLKSEALFYSVDGAHGLHPAYKELYETRHAPKLGEGVVVKVNPSGRYSSDARTIARLKWMAAKANLPLQSFHMRADLPCGTTIGPILCTSLGVEGVDIGLAQLAMHASREMMHLKDYEDLVSLLKLAHLHSAPCVQSLTS